MSFLCRMTGPVLLIAFGLAQGAAADDFDALRADPEIENGVTIVAIADVIRDACEDEFELRRVNAASFFWGLVNRGRDLGYSNSQIRAYVENPDDVARVQARAEQWLIQQGADLSDPATVCAIARDEISEATVIGRLIRER